MVYTREQAEPSAGTSPLLSIRTLSKTFGGIPALKKVDLSVAYGDIHGLLGSNGSGKSTLVKILAGFHAPDHGASMELNGQPVRLPIRVEECRGLGLSFVHQNLGLIPRLSVLENLRISSILSAVRRRIDWRAERVSARQALERFGLEMDLNLPVEMLTQVDKALLAILRAFEDLIVPRSGAAVLVLDEPTPFLPESGVRKLFQMMRRIVESGHGIIFISHDVDEIREITSRLTILRDGAIAGHLVTREASHDQIVEMIMGERVGPARIRQPTQDERQPVLLRLTGLSSGTIHDTDMEIRAGEAVGLTGLIGSGYDELLACIFGACRARAGRMEFREQSIDLASIKPGTSITWGMAFLPADRTRAGGVSELSVADNMTLPSLGIFFRRLLLRRDSMRLWAFQLCQRFLVRPNTPDLPLGALSGGNAQKALLARWMSRSPTLLLLDEPTQGVDVGARRQICDALREAVDRGMAVMCASSDYTQLAEICDRVVIFRRGRIASTLVGREITKANIATACYSVTEQTPE